MGRLRWFMQGVSHYITLWIGVRYGKKFPMHFVCGYPRSGTTWFSEMLADYLNLPRPNLYVLPLGFACVVHTHAPPKHRLSDCFYIIRDGRDCLVSAYFKALKHLKTNPDYIYRKRYLDLFGGDLGDVENNLTRYVRYTFEHSKVHWGEHVLGWMQKSQTNNSIVIVRYEDLVMDPVPVFIKALREKYGEVREDLAIEAVNRQSLDRQRSRPSEQHRTYIWQGAIGSWRKWFTRECGEIFDSYAGEALIAGGYEKDHQWVLNLPDRL